MPRKAARCIIGCSPEFSRILIEFLSSTTDCVTKIARDDGKPLHARGDIDGLAEIILPVVERDREAWPFVDADLEQQILACRSWR